MSATQIQPNSDRCGSGFTRLVTVESAPGGVDSFHSSISPERGRRLCEELERGCILLFLRTPFAFTPEEREFLLTPASGRTWRVIVRWRSAGARRGSTPGTICCT